MKSLNLKGKWRKNKKYHSYKGEVRKIADNLLAGTKEEPDLRHGMSVLGLWQAAYNHFT